MRGHRLLRESSARTPLAAVGDLRPPLATGMGELRPPLAPSVGELELRPLLAAVAGELRPTRVSSVRLLRLARGELLGAAFVLGSRFW